MGIHVVPRNAFDVHGLSLVTTPAEVAWACACGLGGTCTDINAAVRAHAAHKLAACEAEDDERGTL